MPEPRDSSEPIGVQRMCEILNPPTDNEGRPVRWWACPLCGNHYTRAGQCGNNIHRCRSELEPVYGPNAQDVIDALRLVLTQDDAEIELVRILVDEAPPSEAARGVSLLLDLIREGRAKATLR